ncbi:MAG: nucleotidyltransferase family protein [Nitrososphaerota archaeon]|nr:nucleotidyltransferase family protein [Nitrososphaerota archaeon]
MGNNKRNRVIATVLCGGPGSRLRPLTYYFQKSMIPIGSKQKPLLEYIVLLLKKHGIRDIILLAGYKHEQIENYFGDGSRFGVNIRYSLDRSGCSGTGWALLNAYESGLLGGCSDILVYYGDILSDIDLSDLINTHIRFSAYATIAVARGYRVPVGVVYVEGNKVLRMEEKPILNLPVSIGVLVIKVEALEHLKMLSEEYMDDEIDIMSHLIPTLISMNMPVYAYITDRFWYDVGSTERYEKLDAKLVDELFGRLLG